MSGRAWSTSRKILSSRRPRTGSDSEEPDTLPLPDNAMWRQPVGVLKARDSRAPHPCVPGERIGSTHTIPKCQEIALRGEWRYIRSRECERLTGRRNMDGESHRFPVHLILSDSCDEDQLAPTSDRRRAIDIIPISAISWSKGESLCPISSCAKFQRKFILR